MLLPYWPREVVTFLFVINLIVSVLMLISDKLNLNKYKLTKTNYKYLKIVGIGMFLLNFVDPLLADLFMFIGLTTSFILTLKEVEVEGKVEGVMKGGEGEVIEEFKYGKTIFILSVILTVISLTALILAYPYLPERTVVHFGLDMRPNGWMNKLGFALMYLVNVLFVGSLTAFVSWASFEEPGVLYSTSKINSIKLLPIVLLITQVIDDIAMMYLLAYNLGLAT